MKCLFFCRFLSSNKPLCHFCPHAFVLQIAVISACCTELVETVGKQPGPPQFCVCVRTWARGSWRFFCMWDTRLLIPVSSPSGGSEMACHEWLCWAWDFHAWAPALCELIAAEISFWLKDCQKGPPNTFSNKFLVMDVVSFLFICTTRIYFLNYI